MVNHTKKNQVCSIVVCFLTNYMCLIINARIMVNKNSSFISLAERGKEGG